MWSGRSLGTWEEKASFFPVPRTAFCEDSASLTEGCFQTFYFLIIKIIRVSCSLSRPYRVTQDLDRWKKIFRALGMPDMLLFKGGETHACYKLHVMPQEVPTPLYTKCTQSQQDAKILYNKAWFCTCGTILKAMGILLSDPFSRLWEYCLS